MTTTTDFYDEEELGELSVLEKFTCKITPDSSLCCHEKEQGTCPAKGKKCVSILSVEYGDTLASLSHDGHF